MCHEHELAAVDQQRAKHRSSSPSFRPHHPAASSPYPPNPSVCKTANLSLIHPLRPSVGGDRTLICPACQGSGPAPAASVPALPHRPLRSAAAPFACVSRCEKVSTAQAGAPAAVVRDVEDIIPQRSICLEKFLEPGTRALLRRLWRRGRLWRRLDRWRERGRWV